MMALDVNNYKHRYVQFCPTFKSRCYLRVWNALDGSDFKLFLKDDCLVKVILFGLSL